MSNKPVDQRPFPDVILKSQFFDTIGKRSLTSEQRLMLAVLADAINLVQDGCRSQSPRKRSSFVEAKNWIFQSGVRCPLSFENVCDALAIDAEALRWRVALLISGNPDAMPAPLRLRLKEASRVQRLTVNRVRRRTPRTARLRVAPTAS
ncbi:MAG TPA: hypothetical protein VKR29_13040 [Candidatus Binataceae bacterium]|nr:hypothetical protein [Candidatus Binataceae bacterium]